MCHRDRMQVCIRVFVCAVRSCVEESIMTVALNTLHDLTGHGSSGIIPLAMVLIAFGSILVIFKNLTRAQDSQTYFTVCTFFLHVRNM